MLNNSTSVVTGSNSSFVCPGIFNCFHRLCSRDQGRCVSLQMRQSFVLTDSNRNMKGYLSVIFDAV